MPELPEVETVRRGLQPVIEGARIVRVDQRRPDLRFPFPAHFAERLTGARVTALGRRGKYLLADLSSGDTLLMHLGMSGTFRIEAPDRENRPPRSSPAPHAGRERHDHVVFSLADGTRIVFNDPRRFGFMTLVRHTDLADHPLIGNLGVEPTGDALDAALLARLFHGRSMPLKSALLDQRLIAGLGNIYACEILHRAGLSPRRAAASIATGSARPGRRAERLATAIHTVIDEAIAAGGASVRDHRRTDGSLGYFQHAFRVYRREGAACPTPGCDGTVTRIVQSARSTFYCPRCQR